MSLAGGEKRTTTDTRNIISTSRITARPVFNVIGLSSSFNIPDALDEQVHGTLFGNLCRAIKYWHSKTYTIGWTGGSSNLIKDSQLAVTLLHTVHIRGCGRGIDLIRRLTGT